MADLGGAVETERKPKMQGLEFLDDGIDAVGLALRWSARRKAHLEAMGALKFGEAFVFKAVVGLAGFFRVALLSGCSADESDARVSTIALQARKMRMSGFTATDLNIFGSSLERRVS
jgi:hypothetical protein